jgi:hypothetical protein
MADPLQLGLQQRFELERMSRLVDDLDDVPTLRNLCKLTLESWYTQKAATAWVMRQHLDDAPRYVDEIAAELCREQQQKREPEGPPFADDALR